MLTIHNVTLE